MADYKSKRTVSPEVTRDPEIGSGSSDVGENADAIVDKPEARLHRKLRSRHVSMIAIGGAIGTGLIIATGAALAQAGPGAILISYTAVGALVYLVMCALGEMATWIPLQSGFTGYAVRFVDPALGFSIGYIYWIKYIIVTPLQLTAAALVLQYWCPRDRVNPGVFIAIFLLAIISINYFGIRFFGEIEFWMSSIKVTVIVGLIILSLVLVLGGGPDHDRRGFRYWNDPGAFKPYILEGSAGRFLGVWSTFVTATLAYLGTELVGVTVGEAENPRKTIPRAVKLTFYRILFFYCFSVLLLGMLVPYDSKELAFSQKATTSASASPFVVAIQLSGINVLPDIVNASILVFVFSASNSDLYIASRTIYSLALEGKAPTILARTDRRGVPVYALAVSAVFGLLAFMNISNDSRLVFGYFANVVTMFGLLMWTTILLSHIGFVRARRAQGIPNESLVYVAPLGIWGSYVALFFCIVIMIFKNFDVFVRKDATYGAFDYKNFIASYLGIPLYIFLFLAYKIVAKTRIVMPYTADLHTGKAEIDRAEEEFLAGRKKKQAPGKLFYQRFVAWLY